MIAAHPLIGHLLAVAVTVEGATGCPDARQVEERLRPLIPGAGDSSRERPRDVVHLTREGTSLVVTVVRPDGSVAGTRRLAGEHGCAELADAVAVIVASWQLDGALSERRSALPAEPPPLEAAPRPAQPEAPKVATQQATAVPTVAVGSMAQPASIRWELGAGLGTAATGAGVQPAALLSAAAWWRGRAGISMRAFAGGQREITVDTSARAAWRRASLLVGPAGAWSLGPRLRFEAHVGAGISWLAIEGRGLANPRQHDDVLVVLAGAARLTLEPPATRRWRVFPWVEAGGSGWPARTRVYPLPEGEGAHLPRLEFLFALGLSFRL